MELCKSAGGWGGGDLGGLLGLECWMWDYVRTGVNCKMWYVPSGNVGIEFTGDARNEGEAGEGWVW